MARRNKNSLPFDKRGFGVTIRTVLLDSKAYMSLTPQAKVLMTLMHKHWDNYKPVDYGVREAAKKIPCSKNTAMKAFKLLQERGFIEMIEHSVFSSRVDSKTRTWRLTWLPFKSEPPSNDWENWSYKINSTVSKTIPVERHRLKNDTCEIKNSNHCLKNDTCGGVSL